MLRVLALLALALQAACAPIPWKDRYNSADASHRTTAELCRSDAPSEQEFDRCMQSLLPESESE